MLVVTNMTGQVSSMSVIHGTNDLITTLGSYNVCNNWSEEYTSLIVKTTVYLLYRSIVVDLFKMI